jgi:hypothetical protein
MKADAPRSWVYFARAGEDGPVKIGHAKDVRSRLSSMQTGCPIPLTLLGVLPGGREREAELHARFADLRVRGEWFRVEGALVDLIAKLEPLPKPTAQALRQRAPFDWTLRRAQEAVPHEPYTPRPAEDVELPPFEFYTPKAPVENVDEPLVRLRYRRCPVCGEACHPWRHGVKPHGPNGCTGDGTDWTTWPDAPHPDGPRVDRWRHEKGSVPTGASGTP